MLKISINRLLRRQKPSYFLHTSSRHFADRTLKFINFFNLFLSITLLSAFIFTSTGFYLETKHSASADSDVAMKVDVSPVLDLRVEDGGTTSTELNLSLTPLPGGTFVKGDMDVIVSTSNATGYTLTMADKDNDTELKNIDTSVTDSIPSLNATASESSFPINRWGYSLEDITTSDQSFLTIPSVTTPVTLKTSSAPVANDKIPVTFATKVDNTITSGIYQDTVVFSATANYVPPEPAAVTVTAGTGISSTTGAGDYQYTDTVTLTATLDNGYNTPTWSVTNDASGTVVLTPTTGASTSFTMPENPVSVSVQANPNTYTISYSANSGSGAPSSTSLTYDSSSNRLATGTPTRSNYAFLGWSTSSSASSATYSAGQTLTSAQTNSLAGTRANGATITLYAVWKVADINSITTMQEMTSAICVNTATGTTKTLRDTRDNHTYTVRKMEDGECWMTQNLRLGTKSDGTGATVASAITLTPADSDVTSNFSIPTSAIQTSGTTSWSGTYDVVHVYNNGNRWIQPTSSGYNSTVNTSGTPDVQSKYIGNYYNWYTATASTGTQNGVTSGNATSSICPKGWKLPTSDSNTAEYPRLTVVVVNITANSTSVPTQSFKLQSSPYHFVLSGNYYSGVGSQGSSGYWWSSTADSSTYAYSLYLFTSNVYPQANINKYYGFSVRCTAN